ncbi:50S ribosomal protein L32 [Candidatus Beckwithbacteria bacterium CG10_big_fil_rev_8_21_14_0_10_34_10]|uniref:Large ribosomal subunit protein bL32 n=1 Tax=Candidatus Beckwithbacteria bacterium CG10_big_fil_rev_8_21_14_0_10_34_10 TaxID=1974495 RepID=A0A2H0WAK3_9BACT|nr:MAG: 50S ribosomal protein L32 [Candidatus Beckwithbacteria bacterium CG10_big_fil_rev_8_21_14_0_10_34_10]
MGALPKRRISTRRKGKRRANIKVKLKLLSSCSRCGNKKVYRQVCPSCGQE